MLVPVEDYDVCFLGLRRTGNHAVIDWLLAHHNEYTHYNNCTIQGDQIMVDPQEVVQKGVGGLRLVSFEDIEIEAVESLAGDRLKIILLRDLFNTFASRLQMVRNFVNNPDFKFTCLDLISQRAFYYWRLYANQSASKQVRDTAFICFNRWLTDDYYRQIISRALGWKHTDAGFRSTAGWTHSGGSSFGHANNPLESYKHFENDEEFLSYFDQESLDLNETLFGVNPELNLSPQLDYHRKVDQYLMACHKLVSQGNLLQARTALTKLVSVYPGNTQVMQMWVAMERGLFSETTGIYCVEKN